MRAIYTVRPVDARWEVSCTGVPSPLGFHARRNDAVKAARDAAERDLPSRLVVLNRHGTVESDRSFGEDRLEADLEAMRALEASMPAGLHAMPEMEDG